MSSDVFRCSPWVAYEPPPDDGGGDGDGDGDGPVSPQDPPPEPGRTFTKFRVKLRAQDAAAGDGAAQAPAVAAPPGASGGDALDGQPAAGAVPPEQSTSAEQLAMMNTFELGPNKDWKAATIKPPRKKPSKRGAAAGAGATGRGGIRKAATIKNAQRVAAEGEDFLDDASFASSPILGPREISIEPEASTQVPSPSRQRYTPQPQPIPLVDDPGPAPVYPLPGRGLAVAQPIKPTTVAPKDVQIDRTIAPVRRWRIARREIRGIAGGRWFAQSWVGGKDSEWASANAAAQLLSMAAGPSAYAATTNKAGKHTTKLGGTSLPTPAPPPASSSPVRADNRTRDEVESEDVTMIEL